MCDETFGKLYESIAGEELVAELVKKAGEPEKELCARCVREGSVGGALEGQWKTFCTREVGRREEGHIEKPEYGCRLVAKEIKKVELADLFAATPPLQAKKVLFSFVREHAGDVRGFH